MLELVVESRSKAGRWLSSPSKREQVKYLISIGVYWDRDERPPAGYALFTGPRLRLNFDDVWDCEEVKTFGAKMEDIERVVRFAERMNFDQDGVFLCHCWGGVSRSTAVAYIVMCIHLGPGREEEAAVLVMAARDIAQPNPWILELASEHLGRDLLEPWERARRNVGHLRFD